MPVDKKRITGPEETQSPILFQKEDKSSLTLKTSLIKRHSYSWMWIQSQSYFRSIGPRMKFLANLRELKDDQLDEDGKRRDAREANDCRSIFMKAGVVSQAQGSAYIEMGNTKVICAVYGPREVLRREDFSMTGILKCDFKFATFSCPVRRKFQPDNQEKEFALIIEEALSPAICLHKFPKSQVDINIKVLENDGSALAASIIASSVAVADAAIEMYDIVTACSLRLSEDIVLMDPTYHEEVTLMGLDNNSTLTMGLLPSINQTSAMLQRGHVNCERLLKAIQVCTEGCQKIYPIVHESIRRSVATKHKLQREKDSDR